MSWVLVYVGMFSLGEFMKLYTYNVCLIYMHVYFNKNFLANISFKFLKALTYP